LACVALVLLAYHSVAFGGRTFDASTTVPGVNGTRPPTGVAAPRVVDGIRVDRGSAPWQTTPWAQVTHRSYARAQWPLWNPFQGAGEPLAGNVQSAVFDPLLLAVHLHPTTLVWDLTYLFVFALGALAMYAFLRVLGIGVLGAFTGAGAFTMCGFFAMDAGNGFVRVYVYLPILFLSVEMAVRSPHLRWVAAMGAAVAGSVLAGMPEATFFVLVAAGAYATYRLIGQPGGHRAPALFRLGWGALFGVAVASPLLAMFLQYLTVSFNVHGTLVGERTAATAALLYWVVPFANGYPTMPRVPGLQYDRGWSGAAVIALGVVAAATPRAMRRFGGWFFVAVAVVFLARDHNVALFQWIGRLPGFNRSDSIAFAPPLIGFALAALAAVGVDSLAAGEVAWRRLVLAGAALGALLAVLLVANRQVLALSHDVLARRSAVTAVAAGALVAVAASAVAWAPAAKRGRRLRLAIATVASVAVLAEVYVLFPQAIFVPRSNPYRRPPWLALLAHPAADQPAPRVFGYDDVLYPNTAGVFGLQDVRTLNALYVSRYATYLKNFIFPFVDRFDGNGVPSSQIEGNPMFDLLGVRYVLTTTKSLDTGASPTQAAQYTLTGSAGGVRVFENNGRVPRAFVTADVHEVGGMADAVSYLTSLGHQTEDGTTHVDLFDPLHQAVVEVSAGQGTALPAVQGEPRPARIVSYDPERVEVEVPPGAPGLLVLTDSYFPGWGATVNGRRATVLPADVAFRGVMLGSGDSRVVFSYRSPGGGLGWAIPALAIVCLGAVALFSWFSRLGARRRGVVTAEEP
jgi:hypothetical protein